MGENQDISKIIGIIMENPDIIARIKSLADSGNEKSSTGAAEYAKPEEQSTVNDIKTDINPSHNRLQSKKRRRELLTALKPYVKNERAKAIDTMLSVIDVITTIKGQDA